MRQKMKDKEKRKPQKKFVEVTEEQRREICKNIFGNDKEYKNLIAYQVIPVRKKKLQKNKM